MKLARTASLANPQSCRSRKSIPTTTGRVRRYSQTRSASAAGIKKVVLPVDGADVQDSVLGLSKYFEVVSKRGEQMFVAGFAIGLMAGWAVVITGVVFAILMDDHEVGEVDEWGKHTWLNGKEK